MAKKEFQAESRRLLELMINSIYTHQEIFLRELISNASDAIDKLCFRSLTDENVGMERGDFFIRIKGDKENGTLTISDNGIGMTAEEMESNLGVIAKSGSLAFKKDLDAAEKDKADIDVIGQFGVGFYSAFMVASKVTVISRAYGQETANRWESEGADGYTVTPCEKETVGTDVILTMKSDTEHDCYSVYLMPWKIQELVKKYSDYVRWPIRTDVETTEKYETGEVDEAGIQKMGVRTVTKEEVVNSMIPIWQRSKKEASDADCIAFYKEKFKATEDPVSVIRVNAEGTVSYRAMLFVPAKAPYDYYTRDYVPGLRLYSNGVMIMEKCPDLLPECPPGHRMLPEIIRHLLGALPAAAEVQILLARKVVVDDPLGDPRPGIDGIHRRAVIPLGPEYLQGTVQNPAAHLLGLKFPPHGNSPFPQ